MSWYNNIKKLEDNVNIYFEHVGVDYELMQKLLNEYFTAVKNKNRSGELARKPIATQKQMIRHELNCEDLEYKRMLVNRCLWDLNVLEN